jgi:hypothetical protein
MANTKKIIVSVEIKEFGAKEVGNATNKVVKDLTKLTEAERQARIEAEKLKITNAAVTASLKQEAAAALQASAANKNMKATSGLNNAILLETSRLASDASYGFQGIANNLGQLVNLFQISAKNAGGFVTSLKQLGASLLGSGGVLIAIQLLIAFGDDIYNFFFNSTKAADEFDKKIKELTSSIDEKLSKLRSVRGDLLDFEKNSQDLADTILILSKNFSTFENGLKNLKDKGLDKNSDALRQLTRDFFSLEDIQKSIITVEKELQQMDENGNILTKERTLLQEEYRRLLLEQIRLEEIFARESGKNTDKRIRQFKRGFLDLAKLEEKYRQESIYQETLTEQQKIDLKYKNAKEEAQILLNSFVFEQTIRLKRFLAESKDASARQKAIKEYNQSILDAERDFNDVLIQIDAARQNKILESLDRQQSKSLTIRQKQIKKIVELLKFSLDADQEYYDENAKRIQQEIVMREFALRDFTLEQDERAKIEVELFNLREELRQNDLKSEIAATKEKQRVNLEYVNFIQGASQIFKTIAAENAELQKVALILEKGAAIADVVIRTQASNAQIRAGYAATAAIRSAVDPTALARFSALAESQIARNNISAGISIANILATTLTSFKNPSGGAGVGGAGVEVEAPDFNVVGASPESQLAQSVAGQQRKPLRAFVVAKDITNEQELERNIKTTAGLGD